VNAPVTVSSTGAIRNLVHQQTPGSQVRASRLLYPLGPFNGVPGHSVDSKSGRSALNLTDLRLQQHFILHVSEKLSFHPEKKHTWKMIVPGIAAKNEYLMHLLLALAGLDLLSVNRLEGNYTIRNLTCRHHSHSAVSSTPSTPPAVHGQTSDVNADSETIPLQIVIEHHQEGIRGLRDQLAVLSESNAEAVLAGSMMLVAFAFASLRVRGFDISSPNPADSSAEINKPRLDWLYLVRGITSIMDEQWLNLRRGRLRNMLKFSNYGIAEFERPPDVSIPPGLPPKLARFAQGACQAVAKLRAYSQNPWRAMDPARHMTAADQVEEGLSATTRCTVEEHLSAVDLLERMYNQILNVLCFQNLDGRPAHGSSIQGEIEDTVVTEWPRLISDRFMASLDCGREFDVISGLSFTILAHFYLIHSLLDDLWYFKDSVEWEILKVHTVVERLGATHLARLTRWPLEVMAARGCDSDQDG
jgi:hypothetical protein